MDKKLTETQLKQLIDKKQTAKIKGFVLKGEKVEGILKLTSTFEIEFNKQVTVPPKKDENMPTCPKCKTGNIIKGQTAYGCSRWKQGCDFRISFSTIKAKANGQTLTKELVLQIMSNSL